MRIRTLVFLASVCAAASAQASSFADFVKAVDHLHLGEPKVAEGTFTIGHLKVTMADGSAAPVLAGSEPVGIFFHGKGSLEYETTEKAEFPVVAHNVRAVAQSRTPGRSTSSSGRRTSSPVCCNS